MKLGTAIALGLGALLLSSAAQAQVVEWRGGGFVTMETAACTNGGFGNVEYVSVRYRPPKMANNGPGVRMGLFHPLFFAHSYRLQQGLFNSTYKNAIAGGTSATTWTFENQARVRMVTVPARVTRNTDSVRMTGNIQNFGDTKNCRAAFDFSLTKRPE